MKLPLDLNARGAKGRTALHRAAREGRVDRLKALIKAGADIHATDDSGEQALQMAARKGQLDCVKCLIDNGANVNYMPPPEKSEYSQSAICSAVRHSYHLESVAIIKTLLLAGADVNFIGGDRYVPLNEAAESGNSQIVRLLLEAGAKVEIYDVFGKQALHRAVRCEEDMEDILSILLAHGADINSPSLDGERVLFDALGASDYKPKQLRVVLEAKPDLEVIDPVRKCTALEYAILNEEKSLARRLRKAGAKETPNTSDEPSSWSASTGTDEEDKQKGENCEDDAEESAGEDADAASVSVGDDETEDDVLGELPDGFEWSKSSDHLHYLAYFITPKPPYYENWPNISGESGRDAIRRFLRCDVLRLCDDTVRGAFKYTASDLEKMISKGGQTPKGKKAELVIQAQKSAPEKFRQGISNCELYELTELGRSYV